MHHAPKILLLALGSVLAFGSGRADADEHEIHACQDENGSTVFQSYPCPLASEKKSAPSGLPAKRSSGPVPTQPAAPPPPQPRNAASKGPNAPMQSRAVAPAPPRSNGPNPTPSRAQAPPAPVPAFPTVRRGTWVKVPPLQGGPSSRARNLRKQSFPTSLAGAPRPARSSFLSPEQTWRTFLAAIESGDRTAAAACLTPAALETLGPGPESFPLEEVRVLVGTFVRIENEGDLGPFWSIYGVRVKQRPKWILFEKTDTGEWKIAGI